MKEKDLEVGLKIEKKMIDTGKEMERSTEMIVKKSITNKMIRF